MGYQIGTTTFGSNGLATLNLNLTPVRFRITAGPRYNTMETSRMRSSSGEGDDNFSAATAAFSNNDGNFCRQYTSGNKAIVILKSDGSGGVEPVVNVNFDSFATNQIKFDVVNSSANYQVILEVWD